MAIKKHYKFSTQFLINRCPEIPIFFYEIICKKRFVYYQIQNVRMLSERCIFFMSIFLRFITSHITSTFRNMFYEFIKLSFFQHCLFIFLIIWFYFTVFPRIICQINIFFQENILHFRTNLIVLDNKLPVRKALRKKPQ